MIDRYWLEIFVAFGVGVGSEWLSVVSNFGVFDIFSKERKTNLINFQ